MHTNHANILPSYIYGIYRTCIGQVEQYQVAEDGSY